MVRVHPASACARTVHTFAALVCGGFALACGGDSSGPDAQRVVLTAASGDAQFGTPGQTLADSFLVVVRESGTSRAASNVTVRWQVTGGNGVLTVASSVTNGQGIARQLLRFGPDTGTVRIQADADNRTGQVAEFTARAVRTPVLASIAPLPIPTGASVTLDGENFSTRAEDHTVLFGGRRGRVLTATSTRLTVQVPACLPDRTFSVQVRLGAVGSNAVFAAIDGVLPQPLALDRGAARFLITEAEMSCLALDGSAGVRYLLLPLNAARAQGVGMTWELTGLAGAAIAVTAESVEPSRNAALEWEARVRALERSIPPGSPPVALSPQGARAAAMVEIGEQQQFNVLNRQNRTDRITAEVRAISERAIVYVDLQAPSNGFTQAELDAFGEMFDDPIYPTDVQIYGSPSDVDGNDKIIILLTPRVNALTDSDENGFIAGFFYGCDLVDSQRCNDTNSAEIFYSMVPDPTGQFSAPRSRQIVLRTVPGVLAHEFQHMINFGRKGRLDQLWLSEGLAHMAEELVGRVFAQRGDVATAADFRNPNFSRARTYLASPASTSLVDEESPGTLALRGVGWLFVEYIFQHYGGNDLMHRLTGAATLGADNVQAQTNRPWEDVFSEFAVALWASGASELLGVTLEPHLTFGDFALRGLVGPVAGYPLHPQTFDFGDLTRSGKLVPSAAEYFLARAASGSQSPFTLSLSGRFGGAFSTGSPRLAVLRVD